MESFRVVSCVSVEDKGERVFKPQRIFPKIPRTIRNDISPFPILIFRLSIYYLVDFESGIALWAATGPRSVLAGNFAGVDRYRHCLSPPRHSFVGSLIMHLDVNAA